MPQVTTQTLGRYASRVVGDWGTTREGMAGRTVRNLGLLHTLTNADGDEREQLHREITLHWHAMNSVEKVSVLNQLAESATALDIPHDDDTDPTRPGVPNERGPVRHWLDHTFFYTPLAEREALQAASSDAARAVLQPVFTARETLPALEAQFAQHYNNNLIDTLFDYRGLLHQNERLGTVPPGTECAIVGAGISGMAAGHELTKAGAAVDIIEASDRIGGRLRAIEAGHGVKFEEGGMRFPLATSGSFAHFVELLGVETDPNFPNVGTVPSKIVFHNRVIEWPAGQDFPSDPDMQRVGNEFKRVIEQSIMAPLEEARKAGDTAKMIEVWQGFADRFEFVTFEQGMQALLAEHGIEWSAEDFQMFGAIGIGTGGFKNLFPIGFLDVLRTIVDKMETGQQLVTGGTTSIVQRLATANATRPDGTVTSLDEAGAIRLNTEAIGAQRRPDGTWDLSTRGADGTVTTKNYSCIIWTGAPPTLQRAGLTLPQGDEVDVPFTQAVNDFIKEVHLVDSSKLFIKVDNSYWNDNPGATRVITGDQAHHQAYHLPYGDGSHAAILISYTWEDKSSKVQGLTPDQRFQQMKNEIALADPDFAEQLVPLGDINVIDWQRAPQMHGAFKLDLPGGSRNTQAAVAHFQSALPENDQTDNGMYVAGDNYSYKGGWAVGATDTAINAVCAAIQHVGGDLVPGGPLTQNTRVYHYDRARQATEAAPALSPVLASPRIAGSPTDEDFATRERSAEEITEYVRQSFQDLGRITQAINGDVHTQERLAENGRALREAGLDTFEKVNGFIKTCMINDDLVSTLVAGGGRNLGYFATVTGFGAKLLSVFPKLLENPSGWGGALGAGVVGANIVTSYAGIGAAATLLYRGNLQDAPVAVQHAVDGGWELAKDVGFAGGADLGRSLPRLAIPPAMPKTADGTIDAGLTLRNDLMADAATRFGSQLLVEWRKNRNVDGLPYDAALMLQSNDAFTEKVNRYAALQEMGKVDRAIAAGGSTVNALNGALQGVGQAFTRPAVPLAAAGVVTAIVSQFISRTLEIGSRDDAPLGRQHVDTAMYQRMSIISQEMGIEMLLAVVLPLVGRLGLEKRAADGVTATFNGLRGAGAATIEGIGRAFGALTAALGGGRSESDIELEARPRAPSGPPVMPMPNFGHPLNVALPGTEDGIDRA